MNNSKIIKLFIFIAIFSLLLALGSNLNIIRPSEAASSNYLSDDLEITEHRLTLIQEEEVNTVSVIDEFWITNEGNEPYYGFVYNRLPEDIYTREGMTCKVSETGGHSCFGWEHEDYNYFWNSYNVILPKNYATKFNLEISASSINDELINTTIKKEMGSASENVETMVEPDEWGWKRDGFYRGWKSIFNFNLSNEQSDPEQFEIKNLKIPEGLIFEIYIDDNDNQFLDRNDSLLTYDSNYNGFLNSVQKYDSDTNGIPDIELKANENKTLFVYLRADYTLHFYSKFQKTFDPSKDGSIKYSKDTIYDTSFMRVFAIPKNDFKTSNGDISFEKMNPGGNEFYYGTWSGAKNDQVSISFNGETGSNFGNNNATTDFEILIFIVIIFLIIISIIIYMSLRKKRYSDYEEYERPRNEERPMKNNKRRRIEQTVNSNQKEQSTTRRISKAQYQKLINKKKKLKNMITKIKNKEFEDETEKEIELELCLELESKLKNVKKELKKYKTQIEKDKANEEQQLKNAKAITRLTEDYQAGIIDREMYTEMVRKYSGD
jgi:hypothetical protein